MINRRFAILYFAMFTHLVMFLLAISGNTHGAWLLTSSAFFLILVGGVTALLMEPTEPTEPTTN